MKLLDLLLEMYDNNDIREFDPDCCCNSCGSYLLHNGKHSDNCNMVKLFKIIENYKLKKTNEEIAINKYKQEKNDRMNVRITGDITMFRYEYGEEYSIETERFIGQMAKASLSYGDTYDIEEFENQIIDHEFYRYQITTDNFEFIGEIIA